MTAVRVWAADPASHHDVDDQPLLRLAWSDTVRFATAAESLVVGAYGGVIGAEYYDWENGETGWIRARHTVVATGGFWQISTGWSRPVQQGTWSCGAAPRADGNGRDLVADVGGSVVNTDAIGLYGHLVPDPIGAIGATAPAVTRGIWVDAHGARFTDEPAASSMANGEAAASRPGGIVWSILDDESASRLRLDDESRDYSITLDDLQAAGLAHSAPDLTTLALAANLPPEAVEGAVSRWNDQLVEGLPDPFGRDRPDENPIVEAPFHAIRVVVTPCKALVESQSTRENGVGCIGAPHPGLLAAGEAAGMAGGSMVGADFASGSASGFSGSVSAVVFWTGGGCDRQWRHSDSACGGVRAPTRGTHESHAHRHLRQRRRVLPVLPCRKARICRLVRFSRCVFAKVDDHNLIELASST